MVWAVLNQQINSALREVLRSRSDRVVAIVGGAIVDEALLRALQYRMLADKKILDQIFNPEGTLGSFKNRCDIAYLLGIIDKPTLTSMNGMGKIRNIFAHNLDITFASRSPELQSGFDRLSLHVKHSYYPHPFFAGSVKERVRKPRTRKALYVTNMRILMALFMRDLSAHEPYSNIPSRLLEQPPLRDTHARPKLPQK